jgi:hypothetical protein
MQRSNSLSKISAGGCARGGSAPLAGGAGCSGKCQRFLLARDVPPAWGEPSPPRFAPGGGNGKGGGQKCSLLLRAFEYLGGDRISLQLEGHFFVATTPQPTLCVDAPK